MANSPIVGVPRLVEGGESSETQVNESNNMIESIASLKILDRDLTAPPGSESEGDAYIVGTGATGTWVDEDDNIAIYYSGYIFIEPKGGMIAFIHDEKQWYCYSSQESEWHPMQDVWSATEHWTGRYSVIDGDKIYAKTIDCGALPNATSDANAHSVTGIALDNHFKAEGFALQATKMLHLPCDEVQVTLDSTNLNVITVTDLSGYTGSRIRIEYTKT